MSLLKKNNQEQPPIQSDNSFISPTAVQLAKNKAKNTTSEKENGEQQNLDSQKNNSASTGPIQAKLKLGQPNDKYEKEADSMADKVVNNDTATDSSTSVQKKEEESVTSGMSENEVATSAIGKEEDPVSKLTQGKNLQDVDQGIETQLSNSRGNGKSLDPETKTNMEGSFGADFSDVNIHTGGNAVQMNEQLGSKAFTNGNDLYFNENQYKPNSKDGKRLLAHELTHVVQQGAAKQSKNQGGVASSAIQSLMQEGNTSKINSKLFKSEIEKFKEENPASEIQRKQELIQSKSMLGEVKQTTNRSKVQRACMENKDEKEKKKAASKVAASPSASGKVVPQDNFAGRAKKRYGVGEVLDLGSTVPASAPLPAGVGLEWKKKSGKGKVKNTGVNDGKGIFTCDERSGKVELELVLTGGSTAGTVLDTKTFNVIEPNNALIKKNSNLWHVQGKASVGFKGDIFLRPVDVSFNKVNFREEAVNSVATGFWAPHNGIPHARTSRWLSIGKGHSVKGSKMLGQDKISAGPFNGPYSAGTFTWPIPWSFKVGTGAAKEFTTATHYNTIDSSGKTTVAKKGSGTFSKNLNDSSSGY